MEFDDLEVQETEIYKKYIRDIIDNKIIKRRRIESKRDQMLKIMRKKKRNMFKERKTFHRAPLHVSTLKHSSTYAPAEEKEKDGDYTKINSKMEE